MTDRLIIFDTTLRDGEQAPGIALSPDDKVAIASQLARLQVDVIEAGFAASSPGDFEAVARIAATIQGPVIASLARTHPDDIDRADRPTRNHRQRFRRPTKYLWWDCDWIPNRHCNRMGILNDQPTHRFHIHR